MWYPARAGAKVGGWPGWSWGWRAGEGGHWTPSVGKRRGGRLFPAQTSGNSVLVRFFLKKQIQIPNQSSQKHFPLCRELEKH